jgi:hypothetical protein
MGDWEGECGSGGGLRGFLKNPKFESVLLCINSHYVLNSMTFRVKIKLGLDFKIRIMVRIRLRVIRASVRHKVFENGGIF